MAAQSRPEQDGQAGGLPWQRIRAARLAKGWSQEFLARQVGVSQPAIVNIERGWTARSKFLSQIAKVLEIDLTDLDEGLAEMTFAPTARVAEAASSNFPILSSLESGAGDLIVDTQPTEHIARPAPLAHVKGACVRGFCHRRLHGTGVPPRGYRLDQSAPPCDCKPSLHLLRGKARRRARHNQMAAA